MISLFITDIKDFTSQLFLKDSFDSFCFIEGDIVTFNTFHIDGFVQKGFFDTDTVLPEYSYWKNVREYCFNIIKGKRTPLSFRFIFSLSPKNIERIVSQSVSSIQPEDVNGLYLNVHFDGSRIICVTGTSFKTFTLDKTLEHLWDEMITNFLHQKGIPFEQQ